MARRLRTSACSRALKFAFGKLLGAGRTCRLDNGVADPVDVATAIRFAPPPPPLPTPLRTAITAIRAPPPPVAWGPPLPTQ